LHLDPEEESRRYKRHNNSRECHGYVDFLTPVLNEVLLNIPAPARGIDYGCGPGPVLAELLIEAGYEMEVYDPFFKPEFSHFQNNSFDFVSCTEAAEHFFKPSEEFGRIFSLLKPQGMLILMTELFTEDKELKDWYYAKDPTHVAFFSKESLDWLAKKYDCKIEVKNNRLALFRL